MLPGKLDNRVIVDNGLSSALGGIAIDQRVDLRGLEPLTPCMPCRCATSCATDPVSCSAGAEAT